MFVVLHFFVVRYNIGHLMMENDEDITEKKVEDKENDKRCAKSLGKYSCVPYCTSSS